jgi:hypothetical protein
MAIAIGDAICQAHAVVSVGFLFGHRLHGCLPEDSQPPSCCFCWYVNMSWALDEICIKMRAGLRFLIAERSFWKITGDGLLYHDAPWCSE